MTFLLLNRGMEREGSIRSDWSQVPAQEGLKYSLGTTQI